MLNIFKKKSYKKIYIKDKSSMYVWCSKLYAKELNIKPEEIIGKSDYNFYTKKEAEKRIAEDKKIMDTGKVRDIEEKHETKGKASWIREIIIPLKDSYGELSGMLSIAWDVTHEKECQIEKDNIYKEAKELIALLVPVFNNIHQGDFDQSINMPEKENLFTDIYSSAKLAIGNFKKFKNEMKDVINQKDEEIKTKTQDNNILKNKLEQEKAKYNQKMTELEKERGKVEKGQRKLEEINKKHKEFISDLARKLEDRIKNNNFDNN